VRQEYLIGRRFRTSQSRLRVSAARPSRVSSAGFHPARISLAGSAMLRAAQSKEDRGQNPPDGCPAHPVVVDMCTIKATCVSKFGWINNLVVTGFATPAAA